MTKQAESTNKSNDSEPAAIYLSNLYLDMIIEAGSTIPNAITVLLNLAANIESDGVIAVSQAKLAAQSKTTPKKVMKAIADLADAGLISSVEIGSEPDKTITCWVSPELVRRDAPEGPCIQFPVPSD